MGAVESRRRYVIQLWIILRISDQKLLQVKDFIGIDGSTFTTHKMITKVETLFSDNLFKCFSLFFHVFTLVFKELFTERFWGT